MGVASTASRGCGSPGLGLTGVELDTRLMVSVPGATLASSNEEDGWMEVPNLRSLPLLLLTGVPVMCSDGFTFSTIRLIFEPGKNGSLQQ